MENVVFVVIHLGIIIINSLMKNLLYICLLALLFVSCMKTIEYDAPIFTEQCPETINVLNDEYMFLYGNNPMLVDSLLIVSTFDDAHHLAIFNRFSGSLLKEFAKKGQGPSELLIPIAFSVDKTNKMLYIGDAGKKTLLRYNLCKLFEAGEPEYESLKMSSEFEKSSMLRFLVDSLFFAPANKECRILVGVPSEIRWTIDSETPDINKFPTQEDWYNYMNIQSVTAIRPDGRLLAAGSALGGILEVFDLDSRKRVVLKHFYEPIFKQKGHVFRPTPETIGGFAYLAATDKYLYATLHGKVNPTSMPSAICQFDWNGNPIARYDCGKYAINSFTVTDDDEIIYAVATGEEGEQILLEIKL